MHVKLLADGALGMATGTSLAVSKPTHALAHVRGLVDKHPRFVDWNMVLRRH
jgi:hypothetical protein